MAGVIPMCWKIAKFHKLLPTCQHWNINLIC